MTQIQGFFKKRGVSPLIATVLLISFAVALGSVVLNWGRNLEISNFGDPCSGVSVKVRSMEGVEVCYTSKDKNANLKFILDNDGSVDINGLGMWIVGEKGTKLVDFDTLSVKKGYLFEIQDKTVIYDFETYGNIKQVQFIPKVKSADSMEICARNAVKAEKIGICK